MMAGEAVARPNGFSLIEVVVAMLVLTVGVLGMAATSGYMTVQIRVADLRTERLATVQDVVEELRAMPYQDIEGREKAQAVTVGRYALWWDVEPDGINLLHVTIYSSGPGYLSASGWAAAVEEATAVSIARLHPQGGP